MKLLEFRNSSIFVKIDHFWILIRKRIFRDTQTAKGFIPDVFIKKNSPPLFCHDFQHNFVFGKTFLHVLKGEDLL